MALDKLFSFVFLCPHWWTGQNEQSNAHNSLSKEGDSICSVSVGDIGIAVGMSVGSRECSHSKQPLSLTMVSAELNTEEVLGAGTWVKVSAVHRRTGCMDPGEHAGLSKMPPGDFSRVFWVRMAQNISRIIFACWFLFKHVFSGEMQRWKVNHILLGNPIKAFLALVHSVYCPNFPVSLSFPGEGASSMSPAAALGTVGNRNLGQQHRFRASTPALLCAWLCSCWSLPANGAAPGQGSCPTPSPPQGLCTKGSPAAGGRGLDLPGPCWLPRPLSRTWLGTQEWPQQWPGRGAGDAQWLADSQHQLGRDGFFQGKMSWIRWV